ncbi:tautomerase family protein [Cellulomonas aerilata]|uniref:Tautomerase n=1 Tax=Cellulomonas aerilata TaxID=515326 RepID=A0A512DE59_9CELL|nr:tautomerase family protein [Cellulomonas aerilata]GEO34749.1 hypothetical protein CAE01nite_24740 [Cellulomonas aerilata]
MAQVKVYGRAGVLEPLRARLSDVVHAAAVEALGLPADKRFHRFFPMTADDFPTPAGRTERYTVLEVVLFAGRSVATKKRFYALLIEGFAAELGIEPLDLEVTLIETPRHDWAIRGLPGDELDLPYRVAQ